MNRAIEGTNITFYIRHFYRFPIKTPLVLQQKGHNYY